MPATVAQGQARPAAAGQHAHLSNLAIHQAMTIRAAEPMRSGYLQGALLVLGAGLMWSTTGAIMRFAPHLDAWQFLFFRCLGIVVTIGLFGGLGRQGSVVRRFVALGHAGTIAAVALSLAAVGFIVAIKTTTVANTLLLNACSPILSALLGAALLKEKLGIAMLAAIALGLAGMAIMVVGEVQAGNLLGNAAALLAALGFAVSGVCMRWSPGTDFGPAILGYAVLCAAIAALAAVLSGSSLSPPPLEALAGFVSGCVFMALGFALFVRGAPHIPAAGQAVLAQTETIFGPIWVWLLFAEAPLGTTLAGGAVVLVAVTAMAVAGRQQNARALARVRS
jgi:DME family drug/metabolite transporter